MLNSATLTAPELCLIPGPLDGSRVACPDCVDQLHPALVNAEHVDGTLADVYRGERCVLCAAEWTGNTSGWQWPLNLEVE
jgi:hypothetical protein